MIHDNHLSLSNYFLDACTRLYTPLCPSFCRSVGRLVSLSVIDFLIFQKRGFESIISDLSNATKLTLLDSLLREVAVTEIQIATCLKQPSLHYLIHFSKRCVSCRSPVLSSLGLGRQGNQLEHPTPPHTNSP